ncbi:secreted RxLR effector protein 78-like [Nicotiana tabacum]|uniref:Secreted RxLR effector protein 78-like n=1 Tax=Nicotiana tabacum TaxID=4097 RepID=A0AC58ST35_TOBAC
MIIAHELVKGHNKKGVSPMCIIKVDIRKAYDSVEWLFLQMVLQEYGFPNKMVRWIMECVTNVNYFILINGGLTNRFQARKGLRQGDPMSPYLFVLVMEYLSRTLKTLKDIPNFNFHPRCAKLNLTHIYFANDLIM